jgi:hypothetical protein
MYENEGRRRVGIQYVGRMRGGMYEYEKRGRLVYMGEG